MKNSERTKEPSLPILMTASVDTRGMKGADFSAVARETMYLETVRFYLAETASRIIFAENSGWDLESFAKKLAVSDPGRIEFVALDPQDFDISRGKGWNEFKLITEAVGRSVFVSQAGGFLKVTGRYPIYNINRFLREAGNAILRDGCLFYGDVKDHRLYKWLHLPWSGQIGQSVLFACASTEWLSVIEPLRDRLDDAKGYWAEHFVYDYLTAARQAGKRVVCRFSRELRCGGLKGSLGAGAGYSKSNMSLKERFNRLIGNAVRIVAPWFWF